MELISFVTARPGKKAWSSPFSQGSTPSIVMPYGSGMGDSIQGPIPQSGLDRAEWMNVNRARGVLENNGRFCTSGSQPGIGDKERMILGAQRDDYLGGMIVRSHNWYDLNDPATETSTNVSKIWAAQTSASNGLYDENADVYVTQDSETIWA